MRTSSSARAPAWITAATAALLLLAACASGTATPEDAGPIACRTDDACPSGQHCLYWNAGCDQLGVCGDFPPFDASVACCGICDCEGHWRGNAPTTFPFQRRDFGCEQACTPPDGGEPDDPVCNCPFIPLCSDHDAGRPDGA